jgi:hypothetical protein
MPFAAGRGAGTRGFRQVPVRSVLFAAVLAVVMVVATLTFATSLNTLVSHPPLYGWNWNYVLYPTNAVPPQARYLLSHDPLVAGWAGLDYTDAQIDGQAVPIILGRPGAKVARRSCPVTTSTARARSCWARPPCPSCTSTSVTPSPSVTKRPKTPPSIPGLDAAHTPAALALRAE